MAEIIQNTINFWQRSTISEDTNDRSIELTLKDKSIEMEMNNKVLDELVDLCRQKVGLIDGDYGQDQLSIVLENCELSVKFKQSIGINLECSDCDFITFNLKNAKFYGKIKFRHCKLYDTNFFNTSFNNLADFYNCHFFNVVNFYKTDFRDTTVFSASIFYENVLFTYTLIDKLLILRGTTFIKGVDLSLSIGQGEINCFGMHLDDYGTDKIDAVDVEEYEMVYNDFVTQKGKIPLKNKRETFRIFKHTLVSQDNISESINYKVLEKNALIEELRQQPLKLETFLNRTVLFLNRLSNNHGSSYGRAFLFIIFVGGFLFYVSALSSNKYEFVWGLSYSTVILGLGDFFQFLLPTHDLDYLDGTNLSKASKWFFAFDFFGRLFVGYGIYQFIQGFRKYR